VAKEYLAVCALFDIPIGLAKSYVSQQQSDWDPYLEVESLGELVEPALFNFANQTFWKGLCLSVISIKEEISVRSPHQRIAMVKKLVKRGWVRSESFAGQLRLLFTAEAWRDNQYALTRGKLPLSAYRLLQFALSPRVDFLSRDKVTKLFMWILT
jgi:hypothetical protein